MQPDVMNIIDAAYAMDVNDERWLRDVANAANAVLDVGLGMFTVAYDASNPDQFRISNLVMDGIADPVQAVMRSHAALFDRAWVEATFLGFSCDHIRASRFAGLAAGAPDLLDQLYGGHGVQDIFSINAVDPSGLGHQINVLQPRRCRLTAAAKTKWGRVAAHITAGHRLRRRLQRERGAAPEAVLAPDGKVMHAEGEATANEARERLRESARTRERAHGSLRRRDPDLAIAEWKGLVAARWTLVDQFENDGRRYLVARRNDVEMLGLESLSPRERAAVGFAALGHTNKLIAYEMGIAASTVAVLLSRASRRLGVRSRAELMRRFVDDATSRNR